MTDQAHHWSRAAAKYETDFIDPYRSDVRNPLLANLQQLADTLNKTAADLGCGIGPLLPILAEQFQTVYAVDFADGMLERAHQRCQGTINIQFLKCSLCELQ